jgi:trehalose synthase
MAALSEVPVAAQSPERFQDILGERYEEFAQGIALARKVFSGRVVWHINSTARGGGVAELLQSLLAYARGAGVDARWGVIEGNPAFFEVTKRIHNLLHGYPGDGGELGEPERHLYEETLAQGSAELAAVVHPRDMVVLHDPQTAGMVESVRAAGAPVIWRCHVGLDLPNDLARGAWDFLRPYVAEADALVFSREQFVWEEIDPERTRIIPPSIDAFSPKNQELEPEAVAAILSRIGLADGDVADGARFLRQDGTPGRVNRRAELDQAGPIPPGTPLVTQVSRWDRLKDPVGVLSGFTDAVRGGDAHLLLAGPAVAAVSDDPEGAEVLAEVRARRDRLDAEMAARVHLACLPMDDVQENAAMVNAIQRRSDIVVQKSLAEGFGLTVAEAMWKSRPVIASGIGGIQDQIVDGRSGVLLENPRDLDAYGAALRSLLDDPERRRVLGDGAHRQVENGFLGPRHLLQFLRILPELLDPP